MTVFDNNVPYSDNQSEPRIVGYIPASKEVVFRVRDGKKETVLLAQKREAEKRVLARFKERWVTEVHSFEASVGVVLAEPIQRGYPPAVWGSEAVMIHADGGTTHLLSDMPVAGDPTCSMMGTCFVPIFDTNCEGKECDDRLVKVQGEENTIMEEPRGMGPSVSPDGRWLAIVVRDEDGNHRYRLFDMEAQRWGPTLGRPSPCTAIWSPDGRFLAHFTGLTPPMWWMSIWDIHGTRVAEFEVPYRSELLVWGADSETEADTFQE